MAEVIENFSGRLAAAQAPAQHEFIDDIRRADGDFSQEFRAIEEHQQQLEQAQVVGPHIEQHGPRSVSGDKGIESRQNAIGIGQHTRSVDVLGPKLREPFGGGAEVEIRPIFSPEDFGPALTPELREQEARLRAQSEQQSKAANR